VNGSRALPTEDEELLAKILAVEGPIEINIDADWLFDYEKGIIDSKDQVSFLIDRQMNIKALLFRSQDHTLTR
jgi:hypothetical protein